MDYASLMSIDPNRLDQMWLEHTGRYMEMVQHAVDARINYEGLKDRLDVVKAQVDRNIRANPSAYGLEKVTEGAVGAAVLLSQPYMDAQAGVTEARKVQLLTQGAVDAMEHRKKALEEITQLTLSGWRGEARSPVRDASPAPTAAHGVVRPRRQN